MHVLDTEVVVAGAGPTGLMLANELALAGVDVQVLEQMHEPTGSSKALNLQPRTS
ncbi:FAD-dependent monooxygenase [Amycolatopsis sp. NBC_01488]|uniref:FAD-dependent monooxygenase n=1 Tax=Amycolatopsis sp. NBC_01488 TaxID=2903563 RepID=UPI002E2B6783|nr:FAD-dependent monooxygenase [Amycolatopsis sp. NBC_01488]